MKTFPIRTVVMATQLYAFVILSRKLEESVYGGVWGWGGDCPL